ncbi:MAG: aldo/keto reductase [Verrucomicrobia bacterium]|nr:aldo/keto reductase [Verrucomicrobiota bacterium]
MYPGSEPATIPGASSSSRLCKCHRFCYISGTHKDKEAYVAQKKSFEPRRGLGRTGFVATQLGIGDVADRKIPFDQCVATVRRALDAGLNVVDTAPGYEDGYSEQIVGAAVKGCRDGIFVVDKVDHPMKPVAAQVDASLERLGVDFTDAFLLHGVSQLDVWQSCAAPGGAMDQLADCVKAGRTRFRGISSHSADVLKAAIESGLCDILMFPVSAYADRRYVAEILPLAKKKGIGVIGFKCFGAGKLLGDTVGYNQPLARRPRGKVSSGGTEGDPALPHMSVEECLHYTLTYDPDVALLGMSFPNEQDAAFAAARAFRRLPLQKLAAIEAKALEAIRGKGDIWWGKP